MTSTGCYLVAEFQSTPAIAGGRICAGPAGDHAAGRFNPRPPLLAGESRGLTSCRPRWPCFNPRPPLLAGESHWQRRAGWVTDGFQSTPAIAGGRIPSICCGRACWTSVSIHARHCWRANPNSCQRSTSRAVFQSTPAIAGGRILYRSLLDDR